MKMPVFNADCVEGMKMFPDNTFDSIVCDPPYELGFMGKAWDSTGIANNVAMWREALRVLKPGGHLLAFSGSRTYHRMTCAIEDAGFEIRDQIMWLYGSGFPKSLDVSKAIDKSAGVTREVIGSACSGAEGRAEQGAGGYAFGEAYDITAPTTPEAQQWHGFGTALKPAHEPICVARKPLVGTVAANVLQFGTGAINIDACRVEAAGRWPANVIHDGSDEVLAVFPQAPGALAPVRGTEPSGKTKNTFGNYAERAESDQRDGGGSAARFFYCAKASRTDRNEGLTEFATAAAGVGDERPSGSFNERMNKGAVAPRANNHPTVKPTDLMRYLCRLVTPPGGCVLDPFAGSGSTGKAAVLEGFSFIGFEMSAEYAAIANARIKAVDRTVKSDYHTENIAPDQTKAA